MGKIKNFVTGLFSKKKTGDEDEIIQIQPVDEPDRNFIEHESRYDTPDYQAFLNDMGYINADDKRKIDEGSAEDAAGQSVCEVDQDFIDEGVAELGVNDVWPEEEED
jgi:hypothetical protein